MNSFELCADGTQENFITRQDNGRHFVRVRKGPAPVSIASVKQTGGNCCRRNQSIASPESPSYKPTRPTPPAATEKVTFKFGKITVQVRNASDMRVWEESGVLRVCLDT